MDEWVDDEMAKAPGLKRDEGSYPTSLIQDPLAEPPDGDRVCWALVKSTFRAWARSCSLPDKWQAERWAGWDATPISFEPEPPEAGKRRHFCS